MEPTKKDEVELTLEQQFALKSFETMALKMSREQAIAMVIEMYQTMLIRETMFKALLKQEIRDDFSGIEARLDRP